jgi:hypothetical protein
VLGNIAAHRLHRLEAAEQRRRAAEQLAVDLRQQIGIVIRLAAEHHAIEGLQVGLAFLQGLDAAVEDDLQIREVTFDLRRQVIA